MLDVSIMNEKETRRTEGEKFDFSLVDLTLVSVAMTWGLL
jgi:hypothetical protein